ncbi:hypothetical protein M2202_009882 [Bradyrhizobium japonicum]|nr:hypothetical protein [Bradyrhizobium japonicum]MCP1794339.1 hypothetical protein [Bradyrhizobium japonicum]MCP1811391.1 hypothetical protein [Bradyrhizobium japonicum]MCP1821242.1 hypothetical protein [Bradyrhizobium japonicum]MCP1876278.1 hypothetical protein [Bradyrhizobium japonicum]
MKHANDNDRNAPVPRRGMTKDEAADYCGCATTAAFDVWIRKGIVPGAIPGTNRWDRKAIDMALDRASNIEDRDSTVSLLAEWKASKAFSG